jgi:3-deoxy-7-phosphoheptulonate synthase
VLIKRGLANTLQGAFDERRQYVMAGGNAKVVLCERGIRTFETASRNTLSTLVLRAAPEKDEPLR